MREFAVAGALMLGAWTLVALGVVFILALGTLVGTPLTVGLTLAAAISYGLVVA
jgi:hypothetical protein